MIWAVRFDSFVHTFTFVTCSHTFDRLFHIAVVDFRSFPRLRCSFCRSRFTFGIYVRSIVYHDLIHILSLSWNSFVGLTFLTLDFVLRLGSRSRSFVVRLRLVIVYVHVGSVPTFVHVHVYVPHLPVCYHATSLVSLICCSPDRFSFRSLRST